MTIVTLVHLHVLPRVGALQVFVSVCCYGQAVLNDSGSVGAFCAREMRLGKYS